VSHFAALVARHGDRWESSEIELDELDDIEDVADVMRDASIDEGPVVLFVEQDDEWFAIVRVDGLGEPRVFISDARVVPASELGAVLYDAEIPDEILDEDDVTEDEDAESDDEEEAPVLRPDAEPGGVPDLLADLGIPASQLLEMCAEEGMLPADVIAAVCERLGCAEEIEVYR
jgi:putative tRNA adenosine deaminase-associated protein